VREGSSNSDTREALQQIAGEPFCIARKLSASLGSNSAGALLFVILNRSRRRGGSLRTRLFPSYDTPEEGAEVSVH
jgi:hypothetical protein